MMSPDLQPGFLRGTVGHDVGCDHAPILRELQAFGHRRRDGLGVQCRSARDARGRPCGSARRCCAPRCWGSRNPGLRCPRIGVRMKVLMPDHAPFGIHQRPAAVAGIDGRVGLDVHHRRLPACSRRAVELTMPVDTEPSRPSGFPNAITSCPCRSSFESASSRTRQIWPGRS